ncbi:MAG: FAD-binding oxidoreductase, partial [Chloroflexi bacterium]|nr:FAD-binding oxidoreductase [Chloroflexota bacterium]
MAEIAGASVVIIGGGVTGLSTGWWLAQQGVDTIVLEKGIVGWEASGRNGGGCAMLNSPLATENRRLWPHMDELLGYPTEFEADRIAVAVNEEQMAFLRATAALNTQRGFRTELLDPRQLKELVPIVGENAVGGTFSQLGGHANPQR